MFDHHYSEKNSVLEDLAKKETNGDHQRAILSILRCIQSRPHYFAEQLRNAMKVMIRNNISYFDKFFYL